MGREAQSPASGSHCRKQAGEPRHEVYSEVFQNQARQNKLTIGHATLLQAVDSIDNKPF